MVAAALELSKNYHEQVEISVQLANFYAVEVFNSLRKCSPNVSSLHNFDRDGDCILKAALEYDACFSQWSPSLKNKAHKGPKVPPYFYCKNVDELRKLLSAICLKKAESLKNKMDGSSKDSSFELDAESVKWEKAAGVILVPGAVLPEEGIQALADARGVDVSVVLPLSLLLIFFFFAFLTLIRSLSLEP